MNKRFQSRKTVSEIAVKVSDGTAFFPGVISNISHSGLVIDGVSHGLNHRREILSLTVSSKGESYKLRVLPRWVDVSNRKKTVGVRIFSVPRDWYKFVDNL